MSWRIGALVAGAVGAIMLVAGLIGQAVRPDTSVVTSARVETTVAYLPPEMLAYAPAGVVEIAGSGDVVVRAGREADAEAWLLGHTVTRVGEMTDWSTFSTTVTKRDADRMPPPDPSLDIWRESWEGAAPLTVTVDEVPSGLGLVIESDAALGSVALRYEREVNDGWISPMIVAGAVLTAIGAVGAIFRVIDVRPLQERIETRRAQRARTKVARDEATAIAGGRRARRSLRDAPLTSELPEGDKE